MFIISTDLSDTAPTFTREFKRAPSKQGGNAEIKQPGEIPFLNETQSTGTVRKWQGTRAGGRGIKVNLSGNQKSFYSVGSRGFHLGESRGQIMTC